MSGVGDFDWLLDRHERARWSHLDLPPLTDIDHSKVDRELVDGLVTLARAEFSSIPAILDLIRIFRDDADLTAWLSLWFSEEVRHHVVLRRWAEAAGMDAEAMVPPMLRPDLGDPPAVATLAVNVISEIRTTRLYLGMAEASREPVLNHVLNKVAGDEGRHAQGFAHYARKLVEASPRETVPLMLRVGQIWCDPDHGLGDANPAAENYQDEIVAADMTDLHRRYVDAAREQVAVCNLFSRITGLDIDHPRQFGEFLDRFRSGHGPQHTEVTV